MDTYKRNELLIGLAMLAVGLGYLFMTMALPRKGFVDSAFIPYVLSGTLCLLGALQLLAWKKLPQAAAKADQDKATIDYLSVIKSFALVIIYVSLLEPVGFPIATALYLYVQFIVLTPLDQKTNHLLYGVISIVASVSIYFLFRQGFDLLLPAGLLNF